MQDRRDFELAKAQVTQIAFIFLESKICFALKQIQRLNKKFYCPLAEFHFDTSKDSKEIVKKVASNIH